MIINLKHKRHRRRTSPFRLLFPVFPSPDLCRIGVFGLCLLIAATGVPFGASAPPPGAAHPAPSVKPPAARPSPGSGQGRDLLHSARSPSLLYGIEIAWDALFRGGSEREDTARALKLIQIMKAVGATTTRIRLSWGEIEPVRGQYDWRRADMLIRLLKSNDLAVTCLVNGAPSWASDPAPSLRRQAQELSVARQSNMQEDPSALSTGDASGVLPPLASAIPDLGRFAAALGNRYKDSVHRWEFWDHPDEMSPPQARRSGSASSLTPGDAALYARMLRTFSAAIRRADPTCLIGAGEVRGANTAFLHQLYASGAREAFDAVTLDLFGATEVAAIEQADRVRTALLQHGDVRKKIWIASWGWTTYPGMPAGIPEGEQARRIRLLLGAWRRNPFIEMACLQTMNDWLRTGGDTLSLVSAGLCTRDLQAKPGLTAYAVAARHAAPPSDRFHRAGPTAAAPPLAKLSPVQIEVDANDIVGRVPALWRGVQIPTSAHRRLNTPTWPDAGAALVGANAPMLRIKPLRPSAVTLQADGTPVVAWEDADALVQAATRSGMSVIVALSAPPGLTAGSWHALVTAAVRRYGAGSRYGVRRWELDAGGSDVADRYPIFAAAVRAALPGAAVGADLVEDDPLPAARALITAVLKNAAPLDSLGWQIALAPPDRFVAQTVQPFRQLHAVLNRHRELRNTSLLPTISDDSDTVRKDPSWLAKLALRLIDYAPPDAANGIFGFLVSAPILERKQRPAAAWRALAATNAAAGARLRTGEDDADVRCIATRTVNGINLLIWNETAPDAAADRYARILLRNLPRSAVGGWRISRRTIALNPPAGSSSSGQAGAYLPAPAPTLDADTAAVGDLELPVLAAPSTVTLITLRPHPAPVLQVSVSVDRPSAFGGEMQDVQVQVHNPATRPVRAELALIGSYPGLVPAGVSRLDLGAVPAGGTRRLRYPLVLPLVGRDSDMGVTVRASIKPVGAARAAEECRQAVAWRTLAPLTVELETERVDVGADAAPGVAHLRLSNRSATPLPLTILGAGSPVALTLAGGRRRVPVHVPVAASAGDPGLYPAVIQIRSHSMPLLDIDAVVGVPVRCLRVAAPPTINGDLADWKEAPAFALGQEDQWHGRPWGGPEDLSAMVYAVWDERNLYLACAVTQAIFTPPPGSETWQQYDSVLFTIQHNAKAGQGGGMVEERMRLALVGGKQPVVTGGPRPVSARVAVRRTGAHTYYELAVPWAELGMAPQPGLMLEFAAAVFHGDGKTSSRMEWGEVLGDEDRPHICVPFTLEK